VKTRSKITTTAALAAVGFSLAPSLASATPPPAPAGSQSGFDEKVDLVISGGSDTTYNLMVDVGRLYNGAAGCERQVTSVVGVNADDCRQVPAQSGPAVFGNWDHDTVVNTFPTGSSSGIRCLLNTILVGSPPAPLHPNTCTQPVDTARSSRALNGTVETGNLSQFAIARDGVAVISMQNSVAGRTTATLNITQQQAQRIWRCQGPDGNPGNFLWSDLGDTGPNASQPVIPVGMNDGSGTAAFFANYVGDPIATINGRSCVKKLSSGVAPFENDLKQLSNDSVLNNGSASDFNQGRLIWWMSNATILTTPFQAGTATAMKVDGVLLTPATLANTSPSGYPLGRYIYQIARKADIDVTGQTYPATASTSTGAKGGAVREFIRFMCKADADHTVNGDTGKSQATEISGAVTRSGFSGVPTSQRQWGRCRTS
jgi:ABC-type phosphate transport system substrate-binding protein